MLPASPLAAVERDGWHGGMMVEELDWSKLLANR